MKLASFIHAGAQSYGIVTGDGVVDAGRRLGHQSLRAAIGDPRLTSLAQAPADLALADVTLLPPIPYPEKMVCVGLNYRRHAEEAGLKVPANPSLFLRVPSSVVGHEAAMVRPRASRQYDFEGELAVVIGKPGRHIARADALGHVLGYSCLNDGSIRDVQFGHSVIAGKNFAAAGAFGPWIVTADEIPDPGALALVTRLNGREMQRSSTDDMIFDVASLIAYVSGFTPLVPGDVISTGTPEGVGFARKPPVFLAPGDTIEVEIARIGSLRNRIVDEA
jgi:2-keto-4-pentenoate hydratase/2-oxohepta-3-ene-1,7-dioic acid hydratase in catechol pathway